MNSRQTLNYRRSKRHAEYDFDKTGALSASDMRMLDDEDVVRLLR
jgi:hypothetical protein